MATAIITETPPNPTPADSHKNRSFQDDFEIGASGWLTHGNGIWQLVKIEDGKRTYEGYARDDIGNIGLDPAIGISPSKNFAIETRLRIV